MKLHNLGYLLKEGMRNVLHNKLMSFACIGVLLACLLLIGSAAMFSLNVNSMMGYVEDQNEVVLILHDETTRSEIDDMAVSLGAMENIAAVRFFSRDEALASYRLKMGDQATLLDGFEDNNVLPDSYVLRVVDLSALETTVEQLDRLDHVEKVKASTVVADILTALNKTVTYAGIGIVAILVVVSIVIITNTIKITVFSRRKEINIMKYVGATDSFIRLPFLVEGMLIGLIAATLAFFILGASYTYLIQWTSDQFGAYIGIFYSNAIEFRDIALYVFGGFAGLGVFIGVMGSGMFMSRYLKV